MDRLILLRHGEAERDAESGDDFDRALTLRGRREAESAAVILAAAGFAPDLVIVSPAARARQTWAACEPAFPRARPQMEPRLYSADADAIRRLVEAAGETSGAVMVVGHNPGLQDLAVVLLVEAGEAASQQAGMRRRFPTGAAAVFAFDRHGRPRFDAMFLPEIGAVD